MYAMLLVKSEKFHQDDGFKLFQGHRKKIPKARSDGGLPLWMFEFDMLEDVINQRFPPLNACRNVCVKIADEMVLHTSGRSLF